MVTHEAQEEDTAFLNKMKPAFSLKLLFGISWFIILVELDTFK